MNNFFLFLKYFDAQHSIIHVSNYHLYLWKTYNERNIMERKTLIYHPELVGK